MSSKSSPSLPLVLLPGMGTDERIFFRQKPAFANLIIPRWIQPRGSESLADYAVRMVERLRLPDGFVLGGVSMGGMVALEMARHARPESLVLVASARSGKEVSPALRRLRVLEPLAPFSLILPMRRLAMGVLPRSTARQMATMLGAAEPRFLHWACRAILDWDPTTLPDVPVHQIHGTRDHVIPGVKARGIRFVQGGGHLINITHWGEVNEFLAQRVKA